MEKKLAVLKNPHKNHRSRLRRRFLAGGLSSFEPHQVLELLLFFAIPRRDTNPTAHALIAAFGDLDGVFDASAEALCRVPGVASHTASFLKHFAALGRLPARPMAARSFLSLDDLREYTMTLFTPGKRETHFLFFNASLELIDHCAYEGSPHDARFPTDRPLRVALSKNASAVLMAHSHDTPLPLAEDFDITRHFAAAFSRLDVDLIEHYLFGGRDYAALLTRVTGRAPTLPMQREPAASAGNPTSAGDPASANASLREEAQLSSLLKAGGIGEGDLASRLIGRFGSLHSLLSAGEDELAAAALDETAITLLRLVYAVTAYCAARHLPPSCRERAALARYLSRYFRGESAEKLILLLFDEAGSSLSITDLTEGSSNHVFVPYRRLSSVAALDSARYAVVAHNHPGGLGDVSEEDQNAGLGVGEALSYLGVELLGQFILSEDDCIFFGE